MNFTSLEYFLAVAEELSFTRASKRFYISQQALSNRIAAIEQQMGTPLFDRTPPLSMTAAGSCFQEYAQKILDLNAEAMKRITDMKGDQGGELTVAATYSRGRLLMPPILTIFKRRFPRMRVHLVQGNSEELERLLRAGRVDLLLGFTPAEGFGVASEFLCHEELILAIPESVLLETYPQDWQYRLAAMQVQPRLELVAKCPFIKMDETTRVGKAFTMAFNRIAQSPNIFIEAANIETMLTFCSEGLGAMFCPQIFINNKSKVYADVSFHDLYQFPFSEEDEKLSISVSYLKNKYLSFAAKSFISIAKETL